MVPEGPFELAEGLDDDPSRWGYDGAGRGTAAPRAVRQPAAPAPNKAGGRVTLKAAALSAAAHFHSARPDSTEDDLYATATRLLAWLEDGDA